MKKIYLRYEDYDDGIMLCDYSNCHNVRFCGKSFEWSMKPVIKDPFDDKEQAIAAAKKYFTGKTDV